MSSFGVSSDDGSSEPTSFGVRLHVRALMGSLDSNTQAPSLGLSSDGCGFHSVVLKPDGVEISDPRLEESNQQVRSLKRLVRMSESPLDSEMGSLGRKRLELQSIDPLVYLPIVLKGYPFLMWDVSLRLLIEEESLVEVSSPGCLMEIVYFHFPTFCGKLRAKVDIDFAMAFNLLNNGVKDGVVKSHQMFDEMSNRNLRLVFKKRNGNAMMCVDHQLFDRVSKRKALTYNVAKGFRDVLESIEITILAPMKGKVFLMLMLSEDGCCYILEKAGAQGFVLSVDAVEETKLENRCGGLRCECWYINEMGHAGTIILTDLRRILGLGGINRDCDVAVGLLMPTAIFEGDELDDRNIGDRMNIDWLHSRNLGKEAIWLTMVICKGLVPEMGCWAPQFLMIADVADYCCYILMFADFGPVNICPCVGLLLCLLRC